MAIQKAHDVLNDSGASPKIVKECINALRRESQYVKYAITMNYRSVVSGEAVLKEIEDLTEKLNQKL
jgi:hypothetical protein